ncbi:MAG: DUF3109 family protein [Bacteroidetes bacterium]|nr:DUF3109 family protein [Bacteroidota bacterium]
MIEIGKTIVSLDILESSFCCDLEKCKGECCVDGDSGAPVTPEEAETIEKLYPLFEEYLPSQNKEEIAKQGFSLIDSDGDLVTPIIGKNECVFTFVNDKGITLCAIERAYFEKNTGFRKPVSCHLFPIRITEYKRFDGVNYEKLKICKPGRACGKSTNQPLWKYLEEPLIRKYGEAWYQKLKLVAENLPTK